jgi:hypothetical protein
VPLASARQHPENQQKENQAGHSTERTVEGQFCCFVVSFITEEPAAAGGKKPSGFSWLFPSRLGKGTCPWRLLF